MASVLSTQDRKKLRQHEQTIEAGMRSFVEVGNSLRIIRDEQLYLEAADTFEAYCRDRFKFTDRRARQLIESSKVTILVEQTGTTVPLNERQARVLSELPTEQAQATVWTKAVETAPKDAEGNPKVTAAHISKVAAAMASKPAAEPEQKTCRNCGGTEFDDDGDCSKCYEPDDEPEPVRPFANLPSLPPDVSDAFEAFKLCVLRHKLGGWQEISKGDLVATLESLVALAGTPGGGK